MALVTRYLKKKVGKAIPDFSRKTAPELEVFKEKEEAAEAEEDLAERLTRKVNVDEVKLKQLVVPGPTTQEKQKRVKAAIKTQKENVKIMGGAVKRAKAACESNVKAIQAEYVESKQLLRNLKQQKRGIL